MIYFAFQELADCKIQSSMFGGSSQLPTTAEHCFVVWTALKDLITVSVVAWRFVSPTWAACWSIEYKYWKMLMIQWREEDEKIFTIKKSVKITITS